MHAKEHPQTAAAAPSPRPLTGHCVEAEIFSTGEWNGERFTRRDLQEIARNFEHLKDQLKPPLKFGHAQRQTLLGQTDGDPALGWVGRLRVVKDKLVATFMGVPTVVHEAIKAGRYRRVSAELYFGVRKGRRRLGKALKAVALLGADLPAVTNLQDLNAYLAAAPGPALRFSAVATFTLPAPATPRSPLSQKERPMTDTESRAGLEAELAELRAYKMRQDRVKGEEAQRRKKEAFRSLRESVAAFCEEQVRAGRLPPHLSQRLLREVERQSHIFSEGSRISIPLEWVQAFIRESRPVSPEGEVAFSRVDAEAAGEPDPSARLARLATNKMVELNLNYSQAAEYVLRTHPELGRAYRDYTLNPTLGG